VRLLQPKLFSASPNDSVVNPLFAHRLEKRRTKMSQLTRRHLLQLATAPAALALAPAACQSIRPFAESGFVPIGGTEQWIEIRGADRSCPLVPL
jgi:hypothetical protein